MVRSKAQSWLTKSYDAETRAQVQALLDNEDPTELIESFYKDLEFGTGGLRGISGSRFKPYEHLHGRSSHTRLIQLSRKRNLPIWTRSKLSSAMTAVTTAANLLKSLPTFSLQTASRCICSKTFARPLKCHIPSASWDARAVLS